MTFPAAFRSLRLYRVDTYVFRAVQLLIIIFRVASTYRRVANAAVNIILGDVDLLGGAHEIGVPRVHWTSTDTLDQVQSIDFTIVSTHLHTSIKQLFQETYETESDFSIVRNCSTRHDKTNF